ncbi:MAG TPA: acyl-CoA synthetase [Actinomycetes bacterium]|jgi:acetyl-CoA synthetase|nr:acyl-CoA synthetase [Actinomycetes bacterium]
MRDYRTHRPGTYQEMASAFRWKVPASYNLAGDVLDKHEPERPAMRFVSDEGRDERWTFGDLQRLTNRTANALRGLGVGRGDRVAVMAPASPEIAASFLATYKLEAILLSMSVLYGDDSIVYRLNDSEAKVLVTSAAHRDRVADLLDKAPSVEHLVVVGGDGRDSFEELTRAASDRFQTPDTDPDTPAQLYYTSGTTGLAKGILHAHRYLLAHEEFQFSHDVRAGELFHSTGEWAWIAGIVPGILGPWRFGVETLVHGRKGGFDPGRALRLIADHQVGNLFTTPTAIRAMMGVSEAAGLEFDLRLACSAGEPLNPEAIAWWGRTVGCPVLDYYGLSESYPLCGNYPTVEVRPGSMGLPLPGWEVAILDEDERPVLRGEPGEICLRARSNPHYPLGYWNRPEDSREVFGGDWFHTKDTARQDEDGYVWYSGRADDVIISAGYRIGPFEVESTLLEHPAVAESAVVASPDPRRGNVVKAFVRLVPGQQPGDELVAELQRHVRDRLSAYAYPRKVEFVDDLPKTLTGKIRRSELRKADSGSGAI